MNHRTRRTDRRKRAGRMLLSLILTGPFGCDQGAGRSEVSDGAPPRVTNGLTVTALAVPLAAAPGLVPLTNMVLIKAGTFQRQKFKVTISRDFWLGKYEVTQADYSDLMGKNPSHFQGGPDSASSPVEKLNHGDALAYGAALTGRERRAGRLPASHEYRLPSEAEWEYACRAGTTNLFSFGDSKADAAEHGWTWENAEGAPHPVGQKKPNPWGLYDMHGNVWEWTMDWFGLYPEVDVTDPAGAQAGKGRVFRGGGWNNESQFARSANRFAMAPASGIHFVGFRVALGPVRTVAGK